MIAHELKNPVMSIKGLAVTGTRLYGSMTDQERLEFLRLIDQEATRLIVVAEQVSTALRVETGQLVYEMRPASLTELVRKAAGEGDRGEHPMLVDAEGDARVPLDRSRVADVLEIILDNAARYSPPDAPIEVRVGSGPGGEGLVEVIDRGPGIPEEHRESVFERFAKWRPHGYEETPGAGLGLFIARAHVEAHGGRIEIADGPGFGTIFRVSLPAEGGRGG